VSQSHSGQSNLAEADNRSSLVADWSLRFLLSDG